MSAQKTGYYDRTGKAICDGDKVKAIFGQQIHVGYAEQIGDEWFFTDKYFAVNLKFVDDIEILEDES